jgi:Lrp/AsnC family leucine-responsive transcriptional regulator
MHIDAIDHQLIELLTQNSKLGIKELAAHIGLSVTPTYERIKKLKKTELS